MTFREVSIQLHETNHILKFLSFENFRLSDKGELSKEEIISYKILLNQLAEIELKNFQNGKRHADEELKELLVRLKNGERVKTKVLSRIQRLLSDMPSTEYYRVKNSAQLRFGWALTVHKAMSYKWDEVFFNTKTGGGKTNETYFKWVYTALIRATQKISLINYESISPFYKIDIKSSPTTQTNGKELFFVADISVDLSNTNKEISDKFKFPDVDNKSALLQLYQFICHKIGNQKLKVNSINHPNYQELYEIKSGDGEFATLSIYYNKKGQFKLPTLMKSQPKEFGTEILKILKSDNRISDFGFIKDTWRVSVYEQLNSKLTSIDLAIVYIIQAQYKDTIQLIKDKNILIVDMYYDGDGFFSTVSASSCTEIRLWDDFQSIIHELKGK